MEEIINENVKEIQKEEKKFADTCTNAGAKVGGFLGKVAKGTLRITGNVVKGTAKATAGALNALVDDGKQSNVNVIVNQQQGDGSAITNNNNKK